MSIMVRPRPYASAWGELARGGMVKDAVGFKARSYARAGAAAAKARAAAATTARSGGPTAAPTAAAAPTAVAAPAIKPRFGDVFSSPMVRGTAIAAPIVGGVGMGLGYEHAAKIDRKTNEIGAQVPAVAQANIAKAQAPPPQPAAWEQSLGKVRDWAGNNWGWLAGGGAALGGLALIANQRAQRRKEEDEEELLQGLAKAGMAGLLAEFPVQVGFLARCGERGLSGAEVRAAVEKCAAISDAIAEDWIRFFADATGSEAGTASGLVKAAQNPGFAATGNPTAEPLPAQPASVPAPASAPAPAPAPAVTIPRWQPAKPRGAWTAADEAAQAARHAPAPARAPLPYAPMPRWQPAPARGKWTADAEAMQARRSGTTPSEAAVPGIGAATDRLNGVPPPPPRPTGTPAPGAYLTNEQRLMAAAPSTRDMGRRDLWMRQVNAAGKVLENPNLSPMQRAGARADLQRVIGTEPKMEAAGLAGANRPVLSEAQQLTRQNMLEKGKFEVNDAPKEWAASWLGKGRWRPSAAKVEQNQQAMVNAMNRGEDPALLRRSNFSAPENDPTPWSMAAGLVQGGLNAPGALFGVPIGMAADVYHTATGDPTMRHTQAATRDLTGIFTEMMGPRHNEAVERTSPSLFSDYAPQVGKDLSDYGTDPNRGNAVTRALASVASPVVQNAGPILSTLAMGGLPFATGSRAAAGAAGAGGVEAAAAPAANAFSRTLQAGRQFAGENFGSLLPPTSAGARLSRAGSGMFLVPKNLVDDVTLQLGAQTMPTGPQSQTPIQQIAKQEALDKTVRGETPWTRAANPAPTDPDEFRSWANNYYQGQVAGENIRRGTPMNPEESRAYHAQMATPLDAEHRQLVQAAITRQLPELIGPDGQFNPASKIDLTKGYNSRNTLDYVRPRAQSFQRLQTLDQDTLDGLLKDKPVPPEVQQRLTSGRPLSPEDAAVLKQQDIDPAVAGATAERLATSTALLLSTSPAFAGDAHKMAQVVATPQAMLGAARKDPAVAAAAQQKVETGEAPDFMTGLKQTWDGLGTMGQILSVGGLALGAIGLMNAFSGEGGMGSVLTTLLGGGGLLLGLNKGLRDSVMGLMGMGGGEAGGEATPGQMTEEQLAAATAGLQAPGGNGEPTVAGTAPAAPGAANQLGIDVKTLNMQDPATVAQLEQMPAPQQAALVQKAIDAGLVSGDDLATGNKHWGWFQGDVLAKMQAKMKNPNLTAPQARMMLDAFNRLPQSVRNRYRARPFG
jgi:hypothetical protein